MSNTSMNSADTVHLRITMPEFPDVQMVMPFSPDDTVWNVKQRFLQNLKKDLTDGQNYGLYIPPASCRSGKFLEEERCLREYPVTGGIKYFEFKYKNRIKFSFDVSSMKLKKINTLSSQKEFVEWVRRDDVDKTSRLLNKGFNPNYNHVANGETPLTMATTLGRPNTMIIRLVSGGAFLDFRNKKGHTPLHAAVINKNKDAMRTLLDLGSSPNFKDKDNLTPLFLCCMADHPLQLISMLLHERAQLQCKDRHGYTELHHACKLGNKDLVEQLVFYGADMNSQDHNEDTPLHLCASFNHRDCGEVLLIRGADKSITNKNGQTASKVSQYNSNPSLYRFIEDFNSSDIVYFDDLPVYNEKRRGILSAATIRSLEKSRSNPNLHLLFANQLNPASTISAASLNTLANHTNNNVNKNYTSGYVGNNHLPNGNKHLPIRSRPNDKRLSAMELEWIAADKKGKSTTSNKIDSFQSLFEEKSFKMKKKAGKGFGFAIKNVDEVNQNNPCRQYFNEVYEGKGAADAGLMAGDYLLELNGKTVSNVSHDECVRMVKSAGDDIKVKVLRRLVLKEEKPTVNENEGVFTNPVHFNNTAILAERGETSTDSKISSDINDISKKNYSNLKLELEKKNASNDDKVDAYPFSEPPSTAIISIPTSTPTSVTTSVSTSNPQLSTSELQATVPPPPPLPDKETIRMRKPRETLNLVESVSNERRSQSNTLKVKDVTLPNATHNDLLEAIKRRKKVVEDVGSDNISASIESRVRQSKKLNILTKTNGIEHNKERSKHYSFMPQNSLNHQNYGLLASESKTLEKQPKSPPLRPNDRNSVYETSIKSNKSNDYSPTFQAKTLPRKGVKECLNESKGEEGFLANAEKLRLMFLEQMLISTKTLGQSSINEEVNVIDHNSKTDLINTENDSLSSSSKYKQLDVVVKSDSDPSSNNIEAIPTITKNNEFETFKPFIQTNHLETMQPVFKEIKSTIKHNENKENDFKVKEETKVKTVEKIKATVEKPKITLDAGLTNGLKNASPTPSPSIGLLATIVAEKAQQKQDSNRMVQEPSSGTTRVYSAGNTFTKNKSPPKTASPKTANQKPISTLYTSQIPSNQPKPLAKPTTVNTVNVAANKKIYTSATKTPTSSPTKAPTPSIGSNSQKISFEGAKLMFKSANPPPVSQNYNNTTKPPISKLNIQNSNLSNNVSNNSKAFVGATVKTPPVTSPKTFLPNNKPLNSKVHNSKSNENNKIIENNHVSNIPANFNGNSNKPKHSISNFVKSNSDTTESAKRPTDFEGAEITAGKVTTPVEPAFPTLRKTPQQTNTLVFKAKAHSTPNSPPARKY